MTIQGDFPRSWARTNVLIVPAHCGRYFFVNVAREICVHFALEARMNLWNQTFVWRDRGRQQFPTINARYIDVSDTLSANAVIFFCLNTYVTMSNQEYLCCRFSFQWFKCLLKALTVPFTKSLFIKSIHEEYFFRCLYLAVKVTSHMDRPRLFDIQCIMTTY